VLALTFDLDDINMGASVDRYGLRDRMMMFWVLTSDRALARTAAEGVPSPAPATLLATLGAGDFPLTSAGASIARRHNPG
jgi:hypothetical protein